MSQKTILLTGASGFLGSHLAEELSKHNKVIAIVRNSSDLWRCREFANCNLIFANSDSKDFKDSVQRHQPKVLIHSAWEGVTSKGRNDREMQLKNISFTESLLNLAASVGVDRVICFGSQAEYGDFSGRINENDPCNPLSEYGVAKLKTLELVKEFCEARAINWVWIRLFSVYGTREGDSWLIPSLIRNLLSGKSMDLTKCEQRYDYLYVKDFTRAISSVLEIENASGIFNLGSNSSIQLKSLIEKIKNAIDPKAALNFGALTYSDNQVMHMEGDSAKFYKQFNFKVAPIASGTELDKNITELVSYYTNKFREEKILN